MEHGRYILLFTHNEGKGGVEIVPLDVARKIAYQLHIATHGEANGEKYKIRLTISQGDSRDITINDVFIDSNDLEAIGINSNRIIHPDSVPIDTY